MIEDFDEHDGGATDVALMSLVGSAFDEGRRGRDAQDVLARGRRLRRRKRAVPALGALAVVAASAGLALALTGPSGAAGATHAQTGHSMTADGAVVNVDNAAFSVHTDAKTGRVTVTLREFVDQDALKQILATAGIRAYFASTVVSPNAHGVVPIVMCAWPGATPVGNVNDVTPATPGNSNTITSDPSKMPSGSVLAFDFEYLAKTHEEVSTGLQLLSGDPTGCAPK